MKEINNFIILMSLNINRSVIVMTFNCNNSVIVNCGIYDMDIINGACMLQMPLSCQHL